MGYQLRESLDSMPALRKLSLSSDLRNGNIALWNWLSQTPTIANLEEFALAYTRMQFQDFADFVLKHRKTLQALSLQHVNWTDGTTSDLGKFYGELSMAHNLEQIRQWSCYLGQGSSYHRPEMPMHLSWPWTSDVPLENGYQDDDQDEEGTDDYYIWVHTEGSTMRWNGKDLVNAVLKELAACMCRT